MFAVYVSLYQSQMSKRHVHLNSRLARRSKRPDGLKKSRHVSPYLQVRSLRLLHLISMKFWRSSATKCNNLMA